MTVKDLIESFDQLPQPDQRTAAALILRRTTEWDYDPLTDDDLDRLADDLFVMLDEEESAIVP